MEINDRKLPLRIDFISEFYYKNCQHIIDNILGELCPMTILRASTGQLISKCLFGVIVWTKIPTNFFPGFLP